MPSPSPTPPVRYSSSSSQEDVWDKTYALVLTVKTMNLGQETGGGGHEEGELNDSPSVHQVLK